MNTETDWRTQTGRDAETEPSGMPNALTCEAMKELDEGRGVHFDSIEDLFEDLGI